MKAPEQADMRAADKSAVKMVKVKTLREISVVNEDGEAKIVPRGAEVMVTEEEAKEYCDKRFSGYYEDPGFVGYSSKTKAEDIVRAVRV